MIKRCWIRISSITIAKIEKIGYLGNLVFLNLNEPNGGLDFC